MHPVDDRVTVWQREVPGLEAPFLEILLQASRVGVAVEGLVRRVLAPLEINVGEYEVLAALRREGPPYRSSPGALATLLECSSGGVAKRLKKLEEGGYLHRSPDPEDGRGARVALTARGVDLQERVLKALVAASRSRLSGLEEERLAEIAAALRRLAGALEG